MPVYVCRISAALSALGSPSYPRSTGETGGGGRVAMFFEELAAIWMAGFVTHIPL
jgi:hypothetical protein